MTPVPFVCRRHWAAIAQAGVPAIADTFDAQCDALAARERSDGGPVLVALVTPMLLGPFALQRACTWREAVEPYLDLVAPLGLFRSAYVEELELQLTADAELAVAGRGRDAVSKHEPGAEVVVNEVVRRASAGPITVRFTGVAGFLDGELRMDLADVDRARGVAGALRSIAVLALAAGGAIEVDLDRHEVPSSPSTIAR